MYACICKAVPHRDLIRVIVEGARSEEDVAVACGAGTGCGLCLDEVRDALRARRRSAACEPEQQIAAK